MNVPDNIAYSILDFVKSGPHEAANSNTGGGLLNNLLAPQTGELLELAIILLLNTIIVALSVAVLKSRVLADSAIGDFLAFRSNKKLRRLAITCIVLVCSVVYCSCIFRMAPKAFATTDNDNCFNVPDKVTASVDDSYNITWSDAKLKNLSTDTLTLEAIETGPLKEIDDETKEFLENIKLKITINNDEVYNSTIGDSSEPSIQVAPNGVFNIKYSIEADSEQIDRLIKEDNLIAVAFKCTTSAQPAPAPVVDITSLTVNGYRYYPVFADGNVPQNIEWYSEGTNYGTLSSMAEIAENNIDSYVVTSGSASFTAVRCVKETWDDAFGSSTMQGDFATNYSGTSIIEGEVCENLNDSFHCTDTTHSQTPFPKINEVLLTNIQTAYLFCGYTATSAEFWSCKQWNYSSSWMFCMDNGTNDWWWTTKYDSKGILFSRQFS